MTWFNGDYYYNDEEWVEVDGYGYVPLAYLENEHDEDFFQCKECGEWFYRNEYEEYFFEGKTLCENCYEEKEDVA